MRSTAMPPVHATANHFLLAERFFRDRDSVWQQIRTQHRLTSLISDMLISATLALALYGAVLGISNGPLQALASFIKLPLLFLATLAICLPTLYLFNLFYGGRLTARQTLALVLSAITITAMLTLAFAPITVFFLLTAQSYAFFKLLNVAILAITGIAGLRFLLHGVQAINLLDATEAAVGADEVASAGAVSPAARTASAKGSA